MSTTALAILSTVIQCVLAALANFVLKQQAQSAARTDDVTLGRSQIAAVENQKASNVINAMEKAGTDRPSDDAVLNSLRNGSF